MVVFETVRFISENNPFIVYTKIQRKTKLLVALTILKIKLKTTVKTILQSQSLESRLNISNVIECLKNMGLHATVLDKNSSIWKLLTLFSIIYFYIYLLFILWALHLFYNIICEVNVFNKYYLIQQNLYDFIKTIRSFILII